MCITSGSGNFAQSHKKCFFLFFAKLGKRCIDLRRREYVGARLRALRLRNCDRVDSDLCTWHESGKLSF
jgi:hypothetical protein